MKIITRSLIALAIGAFFTACSEKEGETTPALENPTSFAVLAPHGTAYNNGQKVTVNTLAADGALRLDFYVKNNTAAAQTFTLSQRVLSDYKNIANHATFCWDLCYTAPLSSADLTASNIIGAGAIFDASSGDMLNIDPATTPSFEATVEYTITNKGNGEKFTLTGVYKYTKPGN